MKKLIWVLFLFVFPLLISAQVKDYELGTSLDGLNYRQQGGYFDYSDPSSVNIKVAVWGFVRFPGRYNVPINTTITDLLSYAGGPSDDADLEDLRIYRSYEDASQVLLKFDYNDLFWESNLDATKRYVPELTAGDILVVPGEPRLYFRDRFSLVLSVISALVSLTILVLNVINIGKN